MASLVPHAETTAANLARVLRVHTLPSHRWEPHQRASAARRLLEELGVRCDESADDERVEVYAHLIAHALLGPDGPELALAARFEYVPGRAPGERPAHELREELLADAVARAILAGRLEAAPRLIYCRDLGPGRGRFSRAVLRGLHLGSLALYRRSRSYQRLRSLPVVTALTERVHSFLGSAA